MGELGVLVVAAALVSASGNLFVFPRWTPRLLPLLLVLPVGVLLLAHLARARDRAALAAVAFLGWALLSGALSDAPQISLGLSPGRAESVVLLTAVLGCWALGRTLPERGRVLLGPVVLGAVGLSALFALCQVVFAVVSGPYAMMGGRPPGLAVNPVYFGAQAAGAAAYTAYRASERMSWRWAGGYFVSVVFVALSGSRIAMIAALAVAALAVARRPGRVSLSLLPAFVVGIVSAGALQRLTDTERTVSDRLAGGGFDVRLQLWRFGFDAWLDRPLLGYGPGRFRPAVQRRFTPDFVQKYALDDQLETWFESHNLAVQMLVGTGVVGVLLLGAFVVFAMLRSRGPLAWAAGAIATSFMLQPAQLPTLPIAALLFGASFQIARTTDSTGTAAWPDLRRPLVAGALALGLLLASWMAIFDLRVKAAVDSGDVAALESAARMLPRDPLIANSIATALVEPDDPDPDLRDEVLEWSRVATRAEPDFPYWWSLLGVRQILWEDWDGARSSGLEGIRLQPYHPGSLRVLLTVAQHDGDHDLEQLAASRLCEIGLPGCDLVDP